MVPGILFLVFEYIFSSTKKINIKKIILVTLAGIFIGLNCLKIVKPNMYNQVLNMRYYLNQNRLDTQDAITVITDVFKSKNVVMYMINYCLNFVRILFPIELIFKGYKYIPFIVYQTYFSFNILYSIKKAIAEKNEINIMQSALIMAYLLVANLHEPDFGSLIRHEVALYLITFNLFFSDNKVNNEKKLKTTI